MGAVRGDLVFLPADASIRGEVELIADHEHLGRVVQEGMLRARVSLEVATADFKAMLVPGPAAGSAAAGRRPAGGRVRGRAPGRGRRDAAPSIVEHFRGLAAGGVEVRVLHAGVPSGPALQQLKTPASESKDTTNRRGGLTLRRCPRLHAKAVVVDAQWMYLGSANLTGAGLGAKGPTRRNFEWGIVSQDPTLIDAVLGRFNALWEGEHCAGCGRRDVCPVPLEEPRL